MNEFFDCRDYDRMLRELAEEADRLEDLAKSAQAKARERDFYRTLGPGWEQNRDACRLILRPLHGPKHGGGL